MATGIALGILTFLGFLILFLRLPKLIRELLIRFHLLTDAGGFGLTYLLLSGISHSLVALIAASFVGLATSLSISLARYNRGYKIH